MDDVDKKKKQLIQLLKKGKYSYEDIQEKLEVDYAYARKLMQLVREDNVPIEADLYRGRKQFWYPRYEPEREQEIKEIQIPYNEDGSYSFGVFSCAHMGSKYADMDAFHDFYDLLKERNIQVAIGVGDQFEGVKGSTRPTQLNEILFYGYDKSLEYGIDMLPSRKNIQTFVIDGNHDRWWWDTSGANINKQLAQARDDISYVGSEYAELFLNKAYTVLQHGGGGNSYAKSYKLQKYLDGMKRRPDLYFLGHYHKAVYMPYNGTHAFLVGTFKDGDSYGKKIPGGVDVGAWIVTVYEDENGKIKRIVPEFIDYSKD